MFNIINHILVCVSVFLLAGVSSSLSLARICVEAKSKSENRRHLGWLNPYIQCWLAFPQKKGDAGHQPG